MVEKTSNDATVSCCSCGLTTMTKGDMAGWQGVQPSPDVAELRWYCTKTPCVEARDRAIEAAKLTWGYTQGGGP